MRVTPVPFTADGLIGHAAFSGQAVTEYGGASWGPTVSVPVQGQSFCGFTFTGFSAVSIYNGTDNTGDLVASAIAAGTYAFNFAVACDKGLFVDVTGSGKGTIWLA